MNCTGDCCKNFLFIERASGEMRSACCPTEVDLLRVSIGDLTIIRCDPVPNGSAFSLITDDVMGGEGIPQVPCDPVDGYHKFE